MRGPGPMTRGNAALPKHTLSETQGIQRSAKKIVPGSEEFALALAYLFCLALPGFCLARFAYFLADLCIARAGGGGGAVRRVCTEAEHAAPHLARPRQRPAPGEGRFILALPFPHFEARLSAVAVAVAVQDDLLRRSGGGGGVGAGGAGALSGCGCRARGNARGERGSGRERRRRRSNHDTPKDPLRSPTPSTINVAGTAAAVS